MTSKKPGGFYINGIEAMHILVSVVAISLAFTLFPVGSFTAEKFVEVLITVGLAFVLHELAHKYVAVQYGARAEYRAWTWGLFLALGLAFLSNGNFIFAAPGAVYIFGKAVSREENGRIALAGAAMNLSLAIAFLALGLLVPDLQGIAAVGVWVNAFLGAFNLLPFGPLDGSKVFAWNKTAWGIVFFSCAAILFLL